jgi:NAD-dependent SIR2 family protein deacetylase
VASTPSPPPVVLLGAGASKEAGVPTTFEMTEQLVARIAESQPYSQTTQALNFICGALLAYDAAGGASPYTGLDVERVFSAVELLAERRELEVTPFVAAWHQAVDAWDRPSAPFSIGRDITEAIAKGLAGRPFAGSDIDRALQRFVDAKTATGTGETYRQLQRQMIHELRSLVATHPKDVAYLAPLVAAGRAPEGITVATVNYDLSIEHAGAREGVEVSTGIEQWDRERRLIWSDGVRLLKLHGSIDWCWEPAKYEPPKGQFPRRRVQKADDPSGERREPVVVFGQRGKLRAEGPFLSLLSEFEKWLAESNRLIVIGFSFRDEHINEAIRHWLAEDYARTIVLVDPKLPEQLAPGDFRAELSGHLIPFENAEPTFSPRLEVLQVKASDALPQLFP